MKFSVACVSAAGLVSQAQAHGRFLVSQPNGMMMLEVEEDTPDWAAQCEELMKQCKEDEKEMTDDYERNLKALEEEYLRQKRILEDKESVHKDEVADVKAQKSVVKKEKMDVKEARKVVQENAHCPPELERAELELEKQMGIPNDNDEAIDAECRAKKEVLIAKACVEKLRKAQRVLDEEEGDHSAEKSELSGEEGEADYAEDALPPQEKRVADALAAWEAAKRQGPPSSHSTAKDNCATKKDALMREGDDHIKALEDEYRRQKRILDGKEATHEEEKYHVSEQERTVEEEKRHVEEAKVAVKENEHCPPKLEEAKDELAKQEAIPNDTPEDVEAECAATKAVLKWQKCVDELREAELVLAKEKDEHTDEKEDLSGEEAEAADAKAALPPQEQKVADALAALEAARRARDALAECGVEGKKEASPAPPKKDKSGAMATATVSASAATALLLAASATTITV